MTNTGVLTTHGFGPLAGPVARWAARKGASGAAAARIGLVLAAVAAVWFSDGTARGSLVGSVLLAAVLFADAVGERLESSPRDALAVWTTTVLAHLRECALYVGLAFGGVAAGVSDAWTWAAGALIAYALRESVLSALAARPARWSGPAVPAPRPPAPYRGETSPIDAVDPSRATRTRADPAFTDELLGGAPPSPPDPGEQGAPIRIRTTPPSRGGGLTPLSPRTGGTPGPRKPAAPRPAEPDPGGTEPDPGRGGATRRASHRPASGGPLRALAAFSQSERFLVIAVTVTIWDPLVTFVALTVGSAIAVVGALVDPPGPTP